MFDEQGRLSIFEEFRVDQELPKFKKVPKDPVGLMLSAIGAPVFTQSGGATVQIAPIQSKAPWWKFWVRRKREPEAAISVEQFFSSVKGSVEKLDVVSGRAQGYEQALRGAESFGQQALVARLKNNIVAIRAESHLLEMQLTKYLTEEILVRFVRQAPRGLRLDWVANFTRMIPEDLCQTKVECDSRLIFDNYVVLHYDPQGKSWAETEEDKARRRDPILFGVMRDRRRLYYIGDWVDEFCDLTLDQIADALGEEAVSTVSSEIA